MNLNPQFQQIGETFVKQYYLIFDGERDGREKLVNFYHVRNFLFVFIYLDCFLINDPRCY